jgi:hypothetical protein
MPAPLLCQFSHVILNISRRLAYSAIVWSIMVASEMPRPAPPSSSGSAIPIHPSFARSWCKSCGYSPDSSRSAQYSCASQFPCGFSGFWRRTSGYFEQIFEIASRTSICSGLKPDISIRRLEEDAEKHLAALPTLGIRLAPGTARWHASRNHDCDIVLENIVGSYAKDSKKRKVNWRLWDQCQ